MSGPRPELDPLEALRRYRLAKARVTPGQRAVASTMFSTDFSEETAGVGFEEGTPMDRGEARRVRVALGLEEPRLSEQIAPDDPGIRGTLGDMAQGVENAVRGLPSGAVANTLGTIAELVPAAMVALNPTQIMQARMLRESGRPIAAEATEAVREVTQPEGTSGKVGEIAGGLLSDAAFGGALASLKAFRQAKRARQMAAFNDEAMGRVGGAVADVDAADLKNRLAQLRAERRPAEGMERLAQAEGRIAVEAEPPSATGQMLRDADEKLLAPRVREAHRRAKLEADEAAAEADPTRRAMRDFWERRPAQSEPGPEVVRPASDPRTRMQRLREMLETPLTRNESGAVNPTTATTLAGTTGGAASGAALDEEHPLRGAAIGAAVGGALGVAGGRALTRRPALPEGALARDAATLEPPVAPDVTPRSRPIRTAPPRQPGTDPTGIPATPARPDVDEFVNVGKFSFADPSGEQRLRQTVSRVIEAGEHAPKRVVTWDETRAIANGLGLNAGDLSRVKAERLSGPELLAIRDIVSSNVEEIGKLAKQLEASGLSTAAEQNRIATTMNALDAQNGVLLDRFVTARSQKGRDLNNMKIVAMRNREPVAWIARAMQHAGPDAITPELRQRIAELARAGDTAGYLRLVSTLKPSSLSQKIGTVWKANLLTNPLTHVVNTSSNAQLQALEFAKDAPGSVFDRIMALATGRRTLAAPSREQLVASAVGARKGLAEAKLVMRGHPLDDAIQKYDFAKEVNFGDSVGGRILDAYTRTIFRSLGAADRVFKQAAIRGSLVNQAKARGMDAAEVLKNPPEDMVLQAILDAEQATVQDRTAVGEALAALGRLPGGQFVVPFKRTPGAVATRLYEYSPIGGVVNGVRTMNLIRRATRGMDIPIAEQRELAKLMGRATTGSAFIALGWYLNAKGLLTGTTDRRETGERDTNYLTGTPDNALRIGDTYIELGRLNPGGNLLALGANLGELYKEDTDVTGLATGTAGALTKSVIDQPFVSGVSSALEAVANPTEGSRVNRIAQNVATGFVPASAGLGALARGLDPKVREARTVSESIRARIPGLSRTVPAVQDQFGREVDREGGIIDAMLNPARRTRVKTSDPVIAEIERTGATLRRRRPTQAKGREETREQVSVEGPTLHDTLARLIQDARYRNLSKEEQAAAIESVVTRTRARVSRQRSREQRQELPDPNAALQALRQR